MRYQRKNNKKKLLIALLAILLIGGSVYVYQALRADDTNSPQDDSGINFGPPTEEEQRAGDEQKDRIVEEQENENSTTQNSDQKQSANVIIVDADQYDDVVEVRAFISDHVQDGTCFYRFTRNNQLVEKSLPAHADASTTICPNLEVDRTEFPTAGDWQLVVTYESDNAKGSSETKTITIN